MRRIGWQGTTRARQARDLLQERLEQWQEGWFDKQCPELAVDLLLASSLAPSDMVCWSIGIGGEGLLKFEAPSNIEAQLANEALGIRLSETAPFSKAVGKRCFADLCRTLAGSVDLEAPRRCEPSRDFERDPRYGGLKFAVSGFPGSLLIFADREWCDYHLPRTRLQSQAVVDRRIAIGPTRMRVKAAIELGEISLFESIGWKVGELLVTDVDRSSPVHLSASGDVVKSGRLEPDRGPRAVVII